MNYDFNLPHTNFLKPTSRVFIFIFFVFFYVSAWANSLTELLHIKSEIRSLQQTISHNHERQNTLQQQLKTTEIVMGKTSDEITELNHSLKEEERIIAHLKITEQKTRATLELQTKALAQQLRAAYQLGEVMQWKIILNQQDPNSFSRHLTYYRYLNASRSELITQIKQNLDLLTQSLAASKAHEATLKKLVAQKQKQQNQLEDMLHFRQQLLVAIGSQTQTKQQQIEILLANQKRLQDTITRLQAQTIDVTGQPFAKATGRLAWPVKGNLLTAYGSLLDAGNQRSLGVVIEAAAGTPVHAVYSGKIIFTGWLRGFGLLVIINHGDNYLSLYARNRAAYVKTGQTVKTGDIIATTGNSGGYDKSSLYFEIRRNGQPVNPQTWCR